MKQCPIPLKCWILPARPLVRPFVLTKKSFKWSFIDQHQQLIVNKYNSEISVLDPFLVSPRSGFFG